MPRLRCTYYKYARYTRLGECIIFDYNNIVTPKIHDLALCLRSLGATLHQREQEACRVGRPSVEIPTHHQAMKRGQCTYSMSWQHELRPSYIITLKFWLSRAYRTPRPDPTSYAPRRVRRRVTLHPSLAKDWLTKFLQWLHQPLKSETRVCGRVVKAGAYPGFPDGVSDSIRARSVR